MRRVILDVPTPCSLCLLLGHPALQEKESSVGEQERPAGINLTSRPELALPPNGTEVSACILKQINVLGAEKGDTNDSTGSSRVCFPLEPPSWEARFNQVRREESQWPSAQSLHPSFHPLHIS
jgi:hypothetical protein